MKRFKVYGLGAALVDTEISVDDALLAELGVEKGLMTLVDGNRRGALLRALDGRLVEAHHASGGSAGNSVIATALFGGECYMTCCVADDADGRIYVSDLRDAGVSFSPPVKTDEPTGKCLVLVTPDAERSMSTYLGASERLSIEQLNPEALTNSEYVYIEGYLVSSETGLAAAVRAREIAQDAGIPVALSFSDPGMVELFPDQFRQIVGAGVDLVFANEAEAMSWTGTTELADAIEAMKDTAKRFVITCGEDGAVCFDGKQLHEISVHSVDALDSNGAGDMFAGAFLYAITEGQDFPTAGRFASLAAGTVVSQWGPRLAPEQYGTLRDSFFGKS
ncbi:MAG: sugar/nucleoside kinase (ribokinase family) [Glaciecola sp.]|jgi:sugar/nucleoside kinase (ribokinase family)|uniref:adenosine kinase n=1 Tax=Congregibacter sp. TaxID=2744308 RepID=UPI0039E491AA